jgi:UDP-N-acetylenolpyruvoylglucosamine reductase
MESARDILEGCVAEHFPAGGALRLDEPMARHTTMRVGGPADAYFEPAGEEDLAAMLRFCANRGVPVFVLGRGSNLLVRDGGIRGLVVCMAAAVFGKVVVEGERLRCGAGAKLKAIVMEGRRAGLGGIEFMEGIPGSLGGAMRMNAGAMGASVFSAVDRVRFMDLAGEVSERSAGEIPVEYRRCALFEKNIALEASLRVRSMTREAIDEILGEYNRRRWQTQPAAPSAGCIFKNPTDQAAGRLIDEAGLKGARVGGAVVSDRHANFIVNEGSATAKDVLALIGKIQERVKAARGIVLETEVQVVGEEA